MPDAVETQSYCLDIPPHCGSTIGPMPDLAAPSAPARPQPSHRDARAWSRERDQALIAMWSDQLSASEIGRRLGISKNAVIGRSHRLRLPSRPSPIIRNGHRPKPARPESTPPSRALEPVAQPATAVSLGAPSPEPLDRLQPSCRWPIGHPRTAEFAFCGRACSAGKPYCEEHCRRAYIRRPIVCTAEATAAM